jgi:hypothetical protein
MKAKMFEELLESVREGGAILRGQRQPSCRFEIGSSGLRDGRFAVVFFRTVAPRIRGRTRERMSNAENAH